MNITFSVNLYDHEGDCYDECILLHINDTSVLRLNDKKELSELIRQLLIVKEEIDENF